MSKTTDASNKQENQKNKTGKVKFYNRVLLFITLVSISFCVCLSAYVIKNHNNDSEKIQDDSSLPPIEVNEDTTYSGDEVEEMLSLAEEETKVQTTASIKEKIKSVYSGESSVADFLREMYPEDLIYYDKSGYVFCPIDHSLPMNSFKEECFVKDEETGEITYVENGKTISKKGIDISKYQENVDWEAVAESGVDYVMIRIGIRGYGSGALVMDETFDDNIQGALDAGLEVGCYFFSQAVSTEEALEEATFVLQAVENYDITYPIAIDVEAVNDSSARTANLTAAERTDIVIAFLEAVKAEGYTPMIYGNMKSFLGMLEIDRLTDYDKWFAFYDDSVYFPYEIKMWQYTESGTNPGIKGKVDYNLTFEK